MGEDANHVGDQDATGLLRLTVPEAAEALGISMDAVRGRIKRGTIDHVREEDRVYILLDPTRAQPGRDQAGDRGTDQPLDQMEMLNEVWRERVRFLEDQLQQANERDRENRRIIAALTSRIPELEAPRETPEAYEAAAEQQGRGQPSEAAEAPGAQEGTQRRPWWRRWFGS